MAKLRILFVDGDAYIQAKTQRALEPTFEVQCVSSLAEARHLLDTHPPDILIMDVLVNKESGLDLCTYIRQTEAIQHLPIMFLTTRATISDKVAGFQAGADDYVIKPFDPPYLAARVRLLVRIKHLEPHTSS